MGIPDPPTLSPAMESTPQAVRQVSSWPGLAALLLCAWAGAGSRWRSGVWAAAAMHDHGPRAPTSCGGLDTLTPGVGCTKGLGATSASR